MTQVTYLPEIECEATPSTVFDRMVDVTVTDETGRNQYLQVHHHLIEQEGSKTYLAVGIVKLDREKKRALVELPAEADSGANRLWVPFASFRRENVPA